MKTFGLLGRNISYSFSSGYFSEKFTELKLEKYKYVNFDIENLSEFHKLISDKNNPIYGVNVTIPYKEQVMQHLDEIDEVALEIGAVETFNGAHSYVIENTDISEYEFILYFCKPFVVKVGDGQIN